MKRTILSGTTLSCIFGINIFITIRLKMKYHFKVHEEGKLFWAQCIELEGCITQANSMKELHKNMQEALNLYIQEPENSKDLADLPDESIKLSKSIVEVPLDPHVAFSLMLRSR